MPQLPEGTRVSVREYKVVRPESTVSTTPPEGGSGEQSASSLDEPEKAKAQQDEEELQRIFEALEPNI